MKALFLNIGYKCNYNCVYCVVGGIQKEFISKDFVSLKQIININFKGYTVVWLTGGEPTLHPDFFKILDFLKNKKLDILIQTNGSLLGNINFFRKIRNYNISYQLPLNSYIPKIHNVIMKNKNAFNLGVLGIKNIISLKRSNLVIKIILTKLNYKHIGKTVLFLYNLGVRNFYISYPVLKGNYLRYINQLVPRYSEIQPYLNEFILIEKNFHIKYLLESFPYCILNEQQYKNVWEIGQLDRDVLEKLSESKIKEVLDISNNCFKMFGKNNDLNCNSCNITYLKEKLNNISFLHKKLNKEINANCLDNIHKRKESVCLNCNYNFICTGVSKKYIDLFGFKEFNNKIIKNKLTKEKILNYIKYVRKQ